MSVKTVLETNLHKGPFGRFFFFASGVHYKMRLLCECGAEYESNERLPKEGVYVRPVECPSCGDRDYFQYDYITAPDYDSGFSHIDFVRKVDIGLREDLRMRRPAPA